jgi:hypothetical protein
MVMNVHRASADTASAAVDELIIMVEALLWSSSVGFWYCFGVSTKNVSDRSNQKVNQNPQRSPPCQNWGLTTPLWRVSLL